MDTHNKFIDFGPHKGERWTRLPIRYLRHLANTSYGRSRIMAESELKRRGTTMPTEVELTGHAIDRASQITDEWMQKGVHSWLTIIAGEAVNQIIDSEIVHHKGYKFVFQMGNHYPILKTIINKKRGAPKKDASPRVGALGTDGRQSTITDHEDPQQQ